MTGIGASPAESARAIARAAACDWARAMLTGPRVLYLDTETTGFGASAEIVDVGIIDGAGRSLIDSLVRPGCRIPPDATAIHGITDAMVADAPGWDAIGPLVTRALTGATVVVYNASFDLQMVNQMNARHGLPQFRVAANAPGGWHCAMLRYAEYAGVWNEKYGNYRWHRLDAALASFGLAPGGHRALADAAACRLVVHAMAAASAR